MDPSIIVAVASSPSDLDAISELLSALPATCGAAFVVAQHPDPTRREGSPGEALAKRTTLRVVVARDGVVPQRDHVYVMSANTTLTIRDGRIRVSSGASGPLGPSDTLFTSVAGDLGANAIGVVLSGGGSDGALGIRAIKLAGGATLAQFPGSARFASMPISAIDTGCVKFVLRPNEIAHELNRLSRLNTGPEVITHRVPLVSLSVSG